MMVEIECWISPPVLETEAWSQALQIALNAYLIRG